VLPTSWLDSSVHVNQAPATAAEDGGARHSGLGVCHLDELLRDGDGTITAAGAVTAPD